TVSNGIARVIQANRLAVGVAGQGGKQHHRRIGPEERVCPSGNGIATDPGNLALIVDPRPGSRWIAGKGAEVPHDRVGGSEGCRRQQGGEPDQGSYQTGRSDRPRRRQSVPNRETWTGRSSTPTHAIDRGRLLE